MLTQIARGSLPSQAAGAVAAIYASSEKLSNEGETPVIAIQTDKTYFTHPSIIACSVKTNSVVILLISTTHTFEMNG